MRTRNSCREGGFIHKPDESEGAASCVLYFFMCVTHFSPFLAAYGVKKNNPIQVFLQRFFFFSVNSGTRNTGRLLVVMELGNTSVGDRDSCRTPRCAFLFAEAPVRAHVGTVLLLRAFMFTFTDTVHLHKGDILALCARGHVETFFINHSVERL